MTVLSQLEPPSRTPPQPSSFSAGPTPSLSLTATCGSCFPPRYRSVVWTEASRVDPSQTLAET